MQFTEWFEFLQLLPDNNVPKSALSRNTLEEIEHKEPLESSEIKRKNRKSVKRIGLEESSSCSLQRHFQ